MSQVLKKNVRVGADIAPDLAKYLGWAGEKTLPPGRLITAALVCFWKLEPIDQIRAIDEAGNPQHAAIGRTSVVPDCSYEDLVHQMKEERAAAESPVGSVADEPGQNRRHSGAR